MSVYLGNNLLAGTPDITGKADTDAANLSTAGKSLISGLGMPSDRYIDLTLGASGTRYTAPANGYVSFSYSAGHYLASVDDSNNELVASWASDSAISIPVRKGQKYHADYASGGTVSLFRFIYAEGEENV